MNIPPNILNLSSYQIMDMEESERQYQLSVQVSNELTTCPLCNSNNLRKYGHRTQLIKDLPIHGKQVALYVRTQRYQCQDCDKKLPATINAAETSASKPGT